MKENNVFRDSEDIINELEAELRYIPTVPTLNVTEVQQRLELSMSCQHLINLVQELLQRDEYLMKRLLHAETERFKK